MGYLEDYSRELRVIAEIFGLPESAVSDVSHMGGGMTNRSFLFTLGGERYIFRTPGKGSDRFVSRRREAAVYQAVGELGISDEVVYIEPDTGVKITKYYPGSRNVREDERDIIRQCMGILRRLHLSGVEVGHDFDIEERLHSYEAICREAGPIGFEDFETVRERVELPLSVIRESAEPRVLCHIDAVADNFLLLEDGGIRLLDWEYGGMCHGVADIAMFGVYSGCDHRRIDRLLEWYFGRPAAEEEKLLCYSYAAAAGLLWSLWAEYRRYCGEDFGEYAAANYRLGKSYTGLVRSMREGKADAQSAPGGRN